VSAQAFRLYAIEECGPDGYPLAWHTVVKDAVREAAGHRCVRCGHPYRKGEHGNGEWTPCDERCQHKGPLRFWNYFVAEHWPYGAQLAWTELEPTDSLDALHFVVANRPVQARWRILTVHHLNGVKTDLRWWNLAALCQRCHLTVQGRVVMARVWPWEHSTWFKPYVAGYYAHAYLGEDLTREEVEARLDELLNLERAA
jgi:hypothetical protein